MIVDEVKDRNPPGRFLKQDKDSKQWYDIGEKKALDKTRQALREGAPELMNNGKGSSSKGETDGDTAFNKNSPEQQQQHIVNNEFNMLQQSIMSLGNDSFTQAGGGVVSHNPYNMQGIGLSPNMLSSPMNNNNSNSNSRSGNSRLGNQTGGIDLSQVIPPPQVHQTEPDLLQQQQQQRKEQEQQLQQLRFLQQQQRQQQEQQRQQRQQQEQQRQQQEQEQQRQSRQGRFSAQQEQEILRNATAVMGSDFQKQQQQHQPTKMHMDQLRINRLKEKRKLLEQQILHQRQLEILELKKLQNQQKMNNFQDQNQTQPQIPTSSEMRGTLQNRLGAVYAGTEAFLEPTPMPGAEPNQMLPPSSLLSNGTSRSLDVTADLAGGSDDNVVSAKDRRSCLVRENSLKMESIFENAGGGMTTNNPRRKYDMSASGMSMSGTSLSLGFEEESELSALFDTSMKIEGVRGYATTLNDRGTRTPPRSPKTMRDRHGKITSVGGNLLGNTALLGMSLASIGAEKSNSSMSCDSSLSRLFEDTGTSSR